MMQISYPAKHYQSARKRFLPQIIQEFFAREFPSIFGPLIRERVAHDLLAIISAHSDAPSTLRNGQSRWIALDKHTRADSPKRRFVPVVLSVVTEEDIAQYAKGVSPSVVLESVIPRIMNEAYEQGGILSNRDVALLIHRECPRISQIRKLYEQKHQTVLPHTGALHDMGSCITHKEMILRKIVVEKKDPAVAARECNHSQAAVDRYLKDYYRVKTAYEHKNDIEYIHVVTGISKHVVKQYLHILAQEIGEHQ